MKKSVMNLQQICQSLERPMYTWQCVIRPNHYIGRIKMRYFHFYLSATITRSNCTVRLSMSNSNKDVNGMEISIGKNFHRDGEIIHHHNNDMKNYCWRYGNESESHIIKLWTTFETGCDQISFSLTNQRQWKRFWVRTNLHWPLTFVPCIDHR